MSKKNRKSAQAQPAAPVQAEPAASLKVSPNRGKTTGLSVRGWWAKIFAENAVLRYTDAEIASKTQAEFPRNHGIPKDHTEAGIPKVRSWYNSGLGSGQKPLEPALQYDLDGNVVKGPRGWKAPTEPVEEVA